MPPKKRPVKRAAAAALPAKPRAAQKPKRDEFKASVKALLAQRVGYLCSNPACQRPTIGPKMGEPGAMNIGVAAHIKAASVGFARYDEDQTPEQRSSIENGIWLCQDHAHMIDHDEKEYTLEIVNKWKSDAEERARQQIISGIGNATVYSAAGELAEELHEAVALLALPKDADLTKVFQRVSQATLTQIQAFEATSRWPKHSVALEMVLEGEKRSGRLTLERFPKLLMAAQSIVVLAPPGTGKSVTLLQIARGMVKTGPIPLFIPLSEWAEAGTDLFSWVIGRHGFEGLNANYLKFLAYHGELALLLDGWNEVPEQARRRLIMELKGLQRDFPLLYVVMSSRRHAVGVPLIGVPQLNILPLTDKQQVEIARAVKGDEGVSILDAARRTPGIRDLVSIPLYLRSLLELATPKTLPETKEEVIRRMIEAHEAEPASIDLFQRELLGSHERYLCALATAAQDLSKTSLPGNTALATIGKVNRSVSDEGIISTPPDAQKVLNTLVSGHAVIHEGGATYGFQHQQIQEWYASLDLETALRAEAGKLSLKHPLVIKAFNDPNWGETLLFACERMSRADGNGAKVVAEVIALLLKIDPHFAATVISRSSTATWDIVGSEVVRFAEAWHQPDRPDRAVGFMIATQRPEFADIVWPLVSNKDPQIQYETARFVRRLNPSVLGDLLARNYAALPEEPRKRLLTELAHNGDRAGIDTAHSLALSEINMDIRYSVFEGLSFRGATGQLEDLLRQSGSELADIIAHRGYIEGVQDKTLLADLQKRQRALVEAEKVPATRLSQALSFLPDEELPAIITSTLQDPEFSFHDHGAQIFATAASRFPKEAAKALKYRVENALQLPFRAVEYLELIEPTDDESIASILKKGGKKDDICCAAFLAGPKTVGELVKQYLIARQKFDDEGVRTQEAYKPVEALADILEGTRPDILFSELHGYREGLPSNQIDYLCNIISRHGRRGDRSPIPLALDQRKPAVELLNGWGRQMLAQKASRSEMGHLTWAMRRLPDPSQVDVVADMLETDLAMRNQARADFEADNANRVALDEIRTSHAWDYRDTLVAVGSPQAEAVLQGYLADSEFGIDAAIGLQNIWLYANELRQEQEGRFGQWPDFKRAAANLSRDRTLTTDTAEAIFAAINKIDPGDPKADQRAVKLASYAVLLPHGERSAQYAELLALDVAPRMKLELSQRMVVGGLRVDSRLLMAGLMQTIEALPKWPQPDEKNEVLNWLKLFPFSDDPMLLLAALEKVKAIDFAGWQVHDLIEPVKYLDDGIRAQLLREMLKHFPELMRDHYLYRALHTNPGAATLDLLVEIVSGAYGKRPAFYESPLNFSGEMYGALPADIRSQLCGRFLAAENASAKYFLGTLLLAGNEPSDFLLLVADPVGREVIRRSYQRNLQDILYSHKPVEGSTSYYELIPRDIGPLRAGLFDLMVKGDADTATFATECLDQIDSIRDQESGFGDAPRHPNISSDQPWPITKAKK